MLGWGRHLGQNLLGKSLCNPVKRKISGESGRIERGNDILEDAGSATSGFNPDLDTLGNYW